MARSDALGQACVLIRQPLEFNDLDIYKGLLNFTRGKSFSMDIEDSQVEITIRKFISPDRYASEKETRTLTRTIAELAGIEQSRESWRTISANHIRGEVYFGRSVAGEFISQAGERVFAIDTEAIDCEALRMGYNISGEVVNREYSKRMAAFRSRRR